MGSTIDDPVPHLRAGRPLLDLRAPSEFARGALPGAVNLPLLNDAERAAVGTCYAQSGQSDAIALGERLVGGTTRHARIEAWLRYVRSHDNVAIYCWRGGLRSLLVQQWLAAEGCDVPRIAGGYKAMRTACLNAIERAAASQPLLVLGGRTGSGKTVLLRQFDAAIDLEALANHRGSAFGGHPDGQPTPIAFENSLAVELMRRTDASKLLLEDESRTIGRLALPESLHQAMQRAPVAVLDVPIEVRARHIVDEYVRAPLAAGTAMSEVESRLRAAALRIRRRLGGARHAEIQASIETAFASESVEAHVRWVQQLLAWYYDPMYDHQLTRKLERIVIRGNVESIAEYIDSQL